MLTAFTYGLILITFFLMVASLRHPGIAAALMWSMFALEQLLQQGNDFLINRSSWINIGLTVWSVIVVLNSFRAGRFRGLSIPRETLALYGLLIMAALSYYWAVDPDKTLSEYLRNLPYVLAFALLTPLCAVDDRQMGIAIRVTVWFGGIVLLGHLLSNYGFRGVVLDTFRGRDVEGNPLAVASYAGYVGICGIFSIYRQRINLVGVLRLGVLLLAGWLIIRSGSRGQLLALAVVCVVWLPITTRATFKRSTIIAVMMTMLLVLLGIWFIEKYEWSGRWSWDKIVEARAGRWGMAVDLMSVWANSDLVTWLFGLGNSSSFRLVGFYPHNSLIEVMCEEGLVGLALFGVFIGSALLRGLRMMFRKELAIVSRNNLGILLALFSFECILSQKQGSLLSNSMLQCFGCSIGMLMMTYRMQLWKLEKSHRIARVREALQRVSAGEGLATPRGRPGTAR